MTDLADDSLSLHDLLLTLQGVVEDLFRAPLWIRCDVIAAHPRAKGYWRLQIQDPVLGGEASAEVMVWRSQVPAVIHRFERITGQPLQAGMRILLQVRVGYSPKWGFTLTAQSIDPTFTIGQAQLDKDRIRTTLQGEGVWDQQHRLPPPASFSRVALIGPDGSAGLGDVLRETDRLMAVGLCQFETFLAPFEGPNAVPSLTALLARFTDPDHYDAVLLVRGGGGTAGIQTLDHETLVRAVCACPIPVFTGIGHERDHTLLDEVAFGSLGTPSKVVGHIAGTLVAQAQEAEAAWATLRRIGDRRLAEAQAQIQTHHTEARHLADRLMNQAVQAIEHQQAQVHDLAHRQVERADQALLDLQATFLQNGHHLLAQAEQAAQALAQEALGLGPQATLERGYAWISGPKGPLTRATQARQSPSLILHFADGTVTARPEPTP